MKFCPECGNKLSMTGLKFCSECGASLSKSIDKPNQSSSRVDPQSQAGIDLFNAGRESLQRRDFSEAAQKFEPLAVAGDLESMESYGFALAKVGRHDEALHWVREASRAGLSTAATQLGREAADSGYSVRAREWFTIAAEAGDILGQSVLALLCIEARDYECAQRWWTRIIALDSSEHQVLVNEAKNNLAYMQEDPGYIAYLLDKRVQG